jgi:very-short-patch-repair endonuclease
MRRDPRVHVAFDSGAHRPARRSVVAHWRRQPGIENPVENVLTALMQFTQCGDPLDIVIAADSLLNLGLLTEAEVATVLGRTARGRRILSRVDGSAESGTETIVRTRLRARGIRLRPQVTIGGVGRVDFVVGDRLVIEVDGQDWHDTPSQFEKDRARDARLVATGFAVLRFSYRRVMHELAEVEREVLAVVRAGDHLRLRRHDRIARNYG